MRQVDFAREDIVLFANRLNIDLPKNLGDLIYSFRYRISLPPSILAEALEGETWIIRPAGTGKYRFALVVDLPLLPNPNLALTKVPDATPGIIAKYAFNDEQAVLARIRYNRLIDIFLGITSYSLQNHLRTSITGLGQVETDEIYVGIDKRGFSTWYPYRPKAGATDSAGYRSNRTSRFVLTSYLRWSAGQLVHRSRRTILSFCLSFCSKAMRYG